MSEDVLKRKYMDENVVVSVVANDEIGEKTEKILVSKNCVEQLEQYTKLKEDTDINLKNFWIQNGKDLISQFDKYTMIPSVNVLSKDKLNEKLKSCRIIILTANEIEGSTITQCLMEENGGTELVKIADDQQIYQFSAINGINIVHIWPQNCSSFTMYGSYSALRKAFERFKPEYVFSVGVAYGADPINQHLGDVLVADHLVFHGFYNKITDGKIKLSPDEVQAIGTDIFAGCPFLNRKDSLKQSEGYAFECYKGPFLTGSSVISDAVEKARLLQASQAVGYDIVGGEMEGGGIWYACKEYRTPVPFTIVKGICDWAINKNGWSFVSENENEKESIKNHIQAFACRNAFLTLKCILRNISISEPSSLIADERSYKCVEQKQIKSQAYKRHYDNAQQAISNGDVLMAQEYCTKAIKADPQSAEAYNMRGYIFSVVGKYEYMMYNLNKASELNIQYVEPYINRAWYYAKKEDYVLAIQELDKAIEYDSGCAKAFNNRGFYYIILHCYNQAILDLKQAIRLSPEDALPYKNLGEAYYLIDRKHEALNMLTHAIELDSTFVNAYQLRAEIYRAIGDYARAAEDEKKADLYKSHGRKDNLDQ